jgi:hypothetical protein
MWLIDVTASQRLHPLMRGRCVDCLVASVVEGEGEGSLSLARSLSAQVYNLFFIQSRMFRG